MRTHSASDKIQIRGKDEDTQAPKYKRKPIFASKNTASADAGAYPNCVLDFHR